MKIANVLAFAVCIIIAIFIVMAMAKYLSIPVPIAFMLGIPLAGLIGGFATKFLSRYTDGK